MSTEPTRHPNILDLPDDIGPLLDTGLHLSGLPGGNTVKFDLEGHPDLLVRLNEGFDVLEIRLALHAANQAVQYGVYVLPSQVVSRDDQHYVVTQRVKGEPLPEVLASNPGSELLAAVNNHWSSLGSYIMGQMKKRKSVAEDIYDIGQCMFGTTATDPTPRLRMVDLPTYSDSLKFTPDAYNLRLREWIEGLAEAEAVTGRPLNAARAVAEDAFALSLQHTRYGRAAVSQMRSLLR